MHYYFHIQEWCQMPEYRLPRSVYMQRVETMKTSGLWSSLGSHGYYVFTLLGVYLLWCIMFFYFKVNFDLECQGQSLTKTIGILTNIMCFNLWSKFSVPSLNGWWLIMRTSSWLTHWGRVTHICVNKLTTIGSDNGLSSGRRQAIIYYRPSCEWVIGVCIWPQILTIKPYRLLTLRPIKAGMCLF